MGSQRNLLFFALLLVSFLIWTTWMQDEARPPAKVATSEQRYDSMNNDAATQGRLITLRNDVLSITVDTQGGDIKSSSFLTYNQMLNSEEPYHLLKQTPSFIYIAQSGLIGANGIDLVNSRPQYEVMGRDFALDKQQDELRVPMIYRTESGVIYTKVFILKRGSYVVNVEYEIDNVTASPLNVVMYGQLKQTTELPKEENTTTGGNFVASAYRGAAYSTDHHNYKKYSFKNIQSEDLDVQTTYGWVAMLQHYFAVAWIPEQSERLNFYSKVGNKNGRVTKESIIGYYTDPVLVAPKQKKVLAAKLWIGPELQNEMAKAALHLDQTVDYGWFWFISKPLFILLKFIQSFVSNWGVAIILITFVVRGIMYPLTKAQYTSMAKMRLLQPRIEALRDRLGDDKQRLSQEMMALYKEEKVNPLGGCLPLIIQMPIFLGLYYMLSSSVELRHAPFVLWIQDLSAQDPYFILPILMAGTMFLIQKMSPTPVADPMQQKIMTFMPLIFMIFFLWFPSGLVLYYTVSNLVTIIQQQLIYRNLEKRGLHTRIKKK